MTHALKLLYTNVMSIQVGIGLGIQQDQLQAAREAVMQARSNLHSEKISAAILFCSYDFSHPTVLSTIADLLGPVPLIGSSSAAIITSRGIFKHGLVLALLSFPEGVYLNTASVEGISQKGASAAGEELGEKLLYGVKNIRRDLGLIISDGLMRDSSSFLYGLQDRLGKSFPIDGACASDNLTFKKTFVFYNDKVLSDSAVGMLLGGKLNFGLGVGSGWNPLGKLRMVTESSGNTVAEIENKPAVKLYEDYLAKDIFELKKGLNLISMSYPVGIRLEGEKEYLLRTVSSVNDDGSLVFHADVPKNSEIRLMIGSKESCVQAAGRAAEEAKNGLSGKQADLVIIFDSASRYLLLGRQAQKELETIKESLGNDTPIIGFYTYGEQTPLKGINYRGTTYFHNQSIAVLGIGG